MTNFVSTRGLFCFAIFGASLFVSGPVLALGEECAKIENDIARLECFDGVFPSADSEVLSVAEAFSKLNDIAALDSSEESVVLVQDDIFPCTIFVTWKHRISFLRRDLIIVSEANLAGVQRVKSLEARDIGPRMSVSVKGLGMEYDKNTVGYWSLFFGPMSGSPLASIQPKDLNDGGDKSDREAVLFIVGRENDPDVAEISAAVSDMVEACRQ